MINIYLLEKNPQNEERRHALKIDTRVFKCGDNVVIAPFYLESCDTAQSAVLYRILARKGPKYN